MEGGGFFRGTSAEQDARFGDKMKKLIGATKFPPEFDEKVDMKKVSFDAIKPWITEKVTQLLNFEDDVLINYVFSMLEETQFPCPKTMQINITGFLERNAPAFVKELWVLLLEYDPYYPQILTAFTSAQKNVGGIPTVLVEKKKEELRKRKEEQERIKSGLQRKAGDSLETKRLGADSAAMSQGLLPAPVLPIAPVPLLFTPQELQRAVLASKQATVASSSAGGPQSGFSPPVLLLQQAPDTNKAASPEDRKNGSPRRRDDNRDERRRYDGGRRDERDRGGRRDRDYGRSRRDRTPTPPRRARRSRSPRRSRTPDRRRSRTPERRRRTPSPAAREAKKRSPSPAADREQATSRRRDSRSRSPARKEKREKKHKRSRRSRTPSPRPASPARKQESPRKDDGVAPRKPSSSEALRLEKELRDKAMASLKAT